MCVAVVAVCNDVLVMDPFCLHGYRVCREHSCSDSSFAPLHTLHVRIVPKHVNRGRLL